LRYRQAAELTLQAVLIRELFDDFQRKNPVTDAEIKAEYEKFTAANAGQEFKARHILVEGENEAKALIDQIKKGAKFEELAQKVSKDPGSGANGGDLDWANPSNFVPEFSQAMIKLAKGQMTDAPVKSQFGWHIIRVDDVRQAALPPLEEIKSQISDQLKQQKLQKYQQDLQQQAKVK
jgi:peptidyl-prolyl cis-trans isomerase C